MNPVGCRACLGGNRGQRLELEDVNLSDFLPLGRPWWILEQCASSNEMCSFISEAVLAWAWLDTVMLSFHPSLFSVNEGRRDSGFLATTYFHLSLFYSVGCCFWTHSRRHLPLPWRQELGQLVVRKLMHNWLMNDFQYLISGDLYLRLLHKLPLWLLTRGLIAAYLASFLQPCINDAITATDSTAISTAGSRCESQKGTKAVALRKLLFLNSSSCVNGRNRNA